MRGESDTDKATGSWYSCRSRESPPQAALCWCLAISAGCRAGGGGGGGLGLHGRSKWGRPGRLLLLICKFTHCKTLHFARPLSVGLEKTRRPG